MVATPKKIDASALAGGLIAASLLNKLLEKDILTLDEAREVLEAALNAIGPIWLPRTDRPPRKRSRAC
jgi:hypothetical protein